MNIITRVCQLALPWSGELLDNFSGGIHPIQGRAHDTPCVTRSLPNRVKSRQTRGLRGGRITDDTDGRGRSRLGCESHGLWVEISVYPLIEIDEGAANWIGDHWGENLIEADGGHTEPVAGRGKRRRTVPAIGKIHKTLARGLVICSPRKETAALHSTLKRQAGVQVCSTVEIRFQGDDDSATGKF